jgi:peroxiredoxin Q/BCP
MLKEGDTAPKIQLQTDSGEPFDLDDARGKKVVLFFYPKASTPGCTVEACEFRDTFKKFEKKGVVVLGISKDTPTAQTRRWQMLTACGRKRICTARR